MDPGMPDHSIVMIGYGGRCVEQHGWQILLR